MFESFQDEHRKVFDEAIKIYIDKSHVRGQMWLNAPITRELDMISEKLERARAAFNFGLNGKKFIEEFEDSLLDLMNFANFAIKKGRRDNHV